MSELKPDNPIKLSEENSIKRTIPDLGEKMCLFFNIEPNKSKELMDNFIVESRSSGHNNEISFINFFNAKKVLLGKICLKYSSKHENENRLQTESVILNLLEVNNIICPKVIDIGLNKESIPFILMEVINTQNASNCLINIQTSELILNIIRQHELVLINNLETLGFSKDNLDSNKKIDFEKKLIGFLKDFTPQFMIKKSCSFLNSYLNNHGMVQRTIVTDRSVDNIFIGDNNQIIMIDFSTVRIGTQFDNWIQFIEDPRAKFSCSKEELIKLFFLKNNLSEGELDFYYVSSIYTNLLQGIFTHQKNPKLSLQYINNANETFMKFSKKKGVLIDIGH